MKRWIGEVRVSAVLGMPPVVDLSVALSRIISLSSCNIMLGFVVYLFEKGGDTMKVRAKNLTVLSFLLAMILAGGVCNLQAADFGQKFGQRSGGDLKLISSLDLSADEQAALKVALSSNGPAMKTARQQLHAAKKQLRTDLKAPSPDGAILAADATAVATAKAQLNGARAQLTSALLAALTPDHLAQLQAQLTAQFQSRLNAKTGHLLMSYSRTLQQQ